MAVAFVVSLLVHVPLLLLVVLVIRDSEPQGDEGGFFQVTPLFRESDPRHPTEEERREDEEYEPQEETPPGQVVNAAEAGDDERPADAQFLSNRNQSVASQTRARQVSRGNPNQPQQAPQPAYPGRPSAPTAPSDPALLAGLLLRDRGLPLEAAGEEARDQAPPNRGVSPLELSPSYAAMSDALGGAGLDHLRGLDEGEQSLLSTARWRHAPFFQRVKEQVEQYWHPNVAFLRHDPGGHVYGYRDRETVVRVVLHADGRLERAYVIRPSGAFFLDDEALQSIEKAAPFPNPPRGLVDENNQRIVFTFGFTVEVGEQPIFRLRRYR
jgi:TonB family protein